MIDWLAPPLSSKVLVSICTCTLVGAQVLYANTAILL